MRGGKRREERDERRVEEGRKRTEEKKDGPGPVMVSDTLCPSVHILGT